MRVGFPPSEWYVMPLRKVGEIMRQIDHWVVCAAAVFAFTAFNQAFAEDATVIIGGELEFDFVDTENDPTVGEPDPHFVVDQLFLRHKVKFNENVTLFSEIDIKPGEAKMEQVWGKISGLPFHSWVEAGLNRLFIAKMNRKTENRILSEMALYRKEDVGITFGGEPTEQFYWKASLTNGFKLGAISPSEDLATSSVQLLSDVRNPANAPKRLMAGLGAGLKLRHGESARLDLLPFFYTGKLSSQDMAVLKISGNGGEAVDNKIRYGLNAQYDLGEFTLIGQFIKAKDGIVDRVGWFIQPSMRVAHLEFVYRYNDLDVDLTKSFGDGRTWDREQQVFAVITDLYPRVKIKTEYAVNSEDTGGRALNNNEFLMELEMTF